MLVPLPSNRPRERFYRGGDRIAAFRGESATGTHEPEDWVASTTTVRGEACAGATRLPDGRLLADAVAADPVWWLGPEHTRRWGADVRLLVKLLDAGQRLPVHAHPDDAFAARHLGHAHGKAEAWYVLEAGAVHLGLRREVTAAALAALVEAQDTTALLDLLHPIEVARGDVVWVPPGELHAIGAGVFLVEVQQPEDLSILLEWNGFQIDGALLGHLGLGFPTALQAVTLDVRKPGDLEELVSSPVRLGDVLPAGAEEFFRLERFTAAGPLPVEPGFAVLVVVDGEFRTPDGTALPVGTTAVLPAAAGLLELYGVGELLVARPPRP